MRDDCVIALSTTTTRLRRHGEAAVVEIEGEIDLAGREPLRGLLTEVLGQRPTGVVIDLTGIVFFGSTGISLLTDMAALARADGTPVAVVAGHRTVLRPLQITGVDALLTVVPSLDLALRALAPQPSR